MPGPEGFEPMQLDLEENDNVQLPNGGAFIVENPSLDLEAYISNYTGPARLLRLLHIADHCPSLRLDALKMGISHLLSTFNVGGYQQLHKKLRDHAATALLPPPLPDIAGGVVVAPNQGVGAALEIPPLDTAWVEERSKKAALKLEKLDADLKNYKSNSIKESIRRGHDDLAEHYLDMGDLTSALKSFSRSRDYCTSAKHVINMCLNVIRVSIYLQNWSHVLNFVAKAESTPDLNGGDGTDRKGREALVTQTKLKCSGGLASLALKRYKVAAKLFLEASFDHTDFPDLMNPNNVALYGSLCALATFDREELRKLVISSASFKQFLELEPVMREVVFKFYESRYATCLRLLSEMRDNLGLDLYLAPHVNGLYGMIRNRALIQYFSPYAAADLRKMADSFNTGVGDLEEEIMGLILEGQIQGRIDSHNKILFATRADQRRLTFERSLKIGAEYERRMKLMILRSAMLRAQIQVKSSRDPTDRERNNLSSNGDEVDMILPVD